MDKIIIMRTNQDQIFHDETARRCCVKNPMRFLNNHGARGRD